ncbi:serine hydrolase [Gordonia sp. MP11Mi]
MAATSLAACGSDSESASVATVTEVVTATSSTSGGVATSTSVASAPQGKARLTASFGALPVSQPVGLSVVPVGGGEAMAFGDQDPQVAWSTIKVPLALAAERANGPSQAESSAIINSDNSAAESLWASLGSNEQAAAAVTAVLRDGGDERTTVPSSKLRPEYTIFGQTTWPLTSAATFTANLPCLSDSDHLVSLMGQVAGNQQWGVEVIPSRTTAVKGGWGPSATGGYIVRQVGLVTLRNGARAAVAMSTYSPGASMDSGIAALNLVGAWVGRHLASLPSGRCR